MSPQEQAIPLKVITADNINDPATAPYLYQTHC
jgi:hypothetical protein